MASNENLNEKDLNNVSGGWTLERKDTLHIWNDEIPVNELVPEIKRNLPLRNTVDLQMYNKTQSTLGSV